MSDLSRMEGKVDAIQADIAEIKTTLAVNTASLQQHIKRTDILEVKVDSTPQKVLIIVSILSGIAVLGKALMGF